VQALALDRSGGVKRAATGEALERANVMVLSEENAEYPVTRAVLLEADLAIDGPTRDAR